MNALISTYPQFLPVSTNILVSFNKYMYSILHFKELLSYLSKLSSQSIIDIQLSAYSSFAIIYHCYSFQRKLTTLNPSRRKPVGQRRGKLFSEPESSVMVNGKSSGSSKESTPESGSEVKDTQVNVNPDESKAVINNTSNIPMSETESKALQSESRPNDKVEKDEFDDLADKAAAAEIQERQTKTAAKIFSGIYVATVTMDGLNFVGYQFLWRSRPMNFSNKETVICCRNYKGKYYGHNF